MLKKKTNLEWSDECKKFFRVIKECLVTSPVFTCPNYSNPFMVQSDAFAYGLGAVIIQRFGDGKRLISYLSRSLSRNERAFSITERERQRERLALCEIKKLRSYWKVRTSLQLSRTIIFYPCCRVLKSLPIC